MTTVIEKDYFADAADRVAALQRACAAWKGTPFRDRSSVRGEGGGVDCAGFLAAVFLECGAIDRAIAVPPYHVNHAEHSDDSMFRAWFERPAVRAHVRRVEEDEPHVDGDIVFPKVGRTEHHAGIREGDWIHHIARPSGYCAMKISQLVLHRSRYRIFEVQVLKGGFTGAGSAIVRPIPPATETVWLKSDVERFENIHRNYFRPVLPSNT